MLYLLLPSVPFGVSREAGWDSEPRPRPASTSQSAVLTREAANRRAAERTLWASPHRLTLDWWPTRRP